MLGKYKTLEPLIKSNETIPPLVPIQPGECPFGQEGSLKPGILVKSCMNKVGNKCSIRDNDENIMNKCCDSSCAVFNKIPNCEQQCKDDCYTHVEQCCQGSGTCGGSSSGPTPTPSGPKPGPTPSPSGPKPGPTPSPSGPKPGPTPAPSGPIIPPNWNSSEGRLLYNNIISNLPPSYNSSQKLCIVNNMCHNRTPKDVINIYKNPSSFFDFMKNCSDVNNLKDPGPPFGGSNSNPGNNHHFWSSTWGIILIVMMSLLGLCLVLALIFEIVKNRKLR
jgi:hypothetical protein